MNKTVKTIAWICLVLGLLGLAAEVGAYVYGRSRIAQFQEDVETGKIPAFKDHLSDVDGDIDKEEWRENFSDRDGWIKPGGMKDDRRGINPFSKNRG